MYYVDFYDRQQGFATLHEALAECIKEFKRRDFYSIIEIYPNRETKRYIGYVKRGLNGFYYVSMGKRKQVRLIGNDGRFRRI